VTSVGVTFRDVTSNAAGLAQAPSVISMVKARASDRYLRKLLFIISYPLH
jgi:hypothetical protein